MTMLCIDVIFPFVKKSVELGKPAERCLRNFRIAVALQNLED